MKRNSIFIFMLSICMLSIASFQKDEIVTTSINPFDHTAENETLERNKMVVISDLHLGADLSYSESVQHLPRLEQFLKENGEVVD